MVWDLETQRRLNELATRRQSTRQAQSALMEMAEWADMQYDYYKSESRKERDGMRSRLEGMATAFYLARNESLSRWLAFSDKEDEASE